MKTLNLTALIVSVLCFTTVAGAQDANKEDTMRDCPMHKEHAAANPHQALVEKHGDEAMGFSHEKTTHHFLLSLDGGVIEVTANATADKASADAIRSHLSHIVVMFGAGDFSAPMFIHDGIPPGVTTMKLINARIVYKYEELPAGGRVQIQSKDPIAVAAIHDFLRFQIVEHHTGDSLATD